MKKRSQRNKIDFNDDAWVVRLIAETKAEQAKNPMSVDEMLKENDRLARYGAGRPRNSVKPNDVNRLIQESRTAARSAARRIVVALPSYILKDVEWLARLEEMTRDELILEAIRRFLKPHLETRRQVLKASRNTARTFGPFSSAAEAGQFLHDQVRRSKSRKLKTKPADKTLKGYINTIAPTPDWLNAIGDEAKGKGLNKLSMSQINSEIAATRRERQELPKRKRPPNGRPHQSPESSGDFRFQHAGEFCRGELVRLPAHLPHPPRAPTPCAPAGRQFPLPPSGRLHRRPA